MVKGIKQAKYQQAEATAQNIQGMETAVATLDELLSANGLVRDDVTQYVTLPIVTGFVQEVSGRCSAGGSRCESEGHGHWRPRDGGAAAQHTRGNRSQRHSEARNTHPDLARADWEVTPVWEVLAARDGIWH